MRAAAKICALALGAWCVFPGSRSAWSDDLPLPIGLVQGVVNESHRGPSHSSPYQGKVVLLRGVVHQLIKTGSPGNVRYGLFLQETVENSDNNPLTSDGIFLDLGRENELADGSHGYRPLIGDELLVRGSVSERYNLTRLEKPSLVRRVRSGVSLDQSVPVTVLSFSESLVETERNLERLEGMRVQVPAKAIALSGRSSHGEVYVTPGAGSFGRRKAPYERRVFRDPHPLDNDPERSFDDGNGERICLAGNDLTLQSQRETPVLPAVRTFDVLSTAVSGALDFAYGKYRVQVDSVPRFEPGPDPSRLGNAKGPVRSREFSIATFNIENLYDHRDDPGDKNDAPSDPGERGIRPPFNYLPRSELHYRQRLGDLARQIAVDLHSPDVLLLQELEDQDICSELEGRVVSEGGDGRPDVLQDLTRELWRGWGISYDSTLDRDGADARGIVCGYLFRSDRVTLSTAGREGLFGDHPELSYPGSAHEMNRHVENPKAFNASLPSEMKGDREGFAGQVFSRPPQVIQFSISREKPGVLEPVTLLLINNHFSSGPDRRVGVRREQAKFVASLAQAALSAEPDGWVIVGGDLNVYPRPDDPFPSGHPQHPSDQLAPLYEAGLANVYDFLCSNDSRSAYSYVYQGQAQTLDHLFLSPSLREQLVGADAVHINCDWPADYPQDGSRGVSDHDPIMIRIRF